MSMFDDMLNAHAKAMEWKNDDAPELIAVHPADFEFYRTHFGLQPGPTGDFQQKGELFFYGAVFVKDVHVLRGTAQAWQSAAAYRAYVIERERFLKREEN